MSTQQIGWAGHAPSVSVRPVERVIYETLWQLDDYRRFSPGEHCAQDFITVVNPQPGSTVLDLGCGTGRGGMALHVIGNLDVVFIDFAANCLDERVKAAVERSERLKFVQADLAKGVPETAMYGYCTDCMEHIPPSQVDRVLDNILKAAQHVFFQISTVDDHFGKAVGHALHLSVHPYEWWMEKFKERECKIHWSANKVNSCCFYVSAWATGDEVTDAGVRNVNDDKVRENVEHNIQQGWKQIEPHVTNDVEVMLLGGGPTLASYEDEIRQLRKDGIKLITMNGSYNWCLDRGIIPSAQVVLDARAFNARFTRPVVDNVAYFIASQCDPAVLEGLPKDRTYLWHTTTAVVEDILNKHLERWWGVPGGSTVLLRTLPMMRMLGFKRFHLFGCDSCIVGESSHAYSQPENDHDIAVPCTFGKRVFQCTPWMASQASEFLDLIKMMGDEIELSIRGNGLLAYILEHCADLDSESAKIQLV